MTDNILIKNKKRKEKVKDVMDKDHSENKEVIL